jgi:hypothetical protein
VRVLPTDRKWRWQVIDEEMQVPPSRLVAAGRGDEGVDCRAWHGLGDVSGGMRDTGVTTAGTLGAAFFHIGWPVRRQLRRHADDGAGRLGGKGGGMRDAGVAGKAVVMGRPRAMAGVMPGKVGRGPGDRG